VPSISAISLTLRNWLIGWHIEGYERLGVDLAQYGENLMDRLADELTRQGVSRCDRRELYRYRLFYLSYHQIVESLPPQFKSTVNSARKSARSAQNPATRRFGSRRLPKSAFPGKS